jgi:hypothetical protein
MCSTAHVSFLNLSPLCWWKESASCWMLFLSWQNPSRAFLITCSLYKLNRISDKLHPCVIPLPVFTLLVFHQVWLRPNTLIHIQSILHGQMPAAGLWSKHTIPHLFWKFVLILFLASQFHPWFLFHLKTKTYILQVRPEFSFLSSF